MRPPLRLKNTANTTSAINPANATNWTKYVPIKSMTITGMSLATWVALYCAAPRRDSAMVFMLIAITYPV